jgi:opacity protein-like surface antigen
MRRAALPLVILPLLAAAVSSAAETNTPAWLPPRPAWLTELAVTVRESYDDNIFLAGVQAARLPGGYTVPDGGVAARRNCYSWITTVSPRLGLDFAPLLGARDVLPALTLGYAPDFVTFHDAPTESYTLHRLTSGLKAQAHDLTLNVDNALSFVDGSKYGPSYPGTAYYSSFVNSTVRERRRQTQDKATATLQYDQPDWFVRGVGSFQNYNLLTRQLPTATYSGYLSYPDRNDANAGFDFGYRLATNFALTVGWRIGEQDQEKLLASVDKYRQSSASEYQRLLFGFEGKPCSWLNAKFQGGPDFRDYSRSAPVREHSPVSFYGEGSLEAKATKRDSFTFRYREWRWVSSTGKVPDDETQFDLNYTRKLTDRLQATLGVRVARADYHCGLSYSSTAHTPETAPVNPRDDWDYTGTAGVRYAFTPNFSADLGYMLDLGRNADANTDDGLRNFNRQVVSLGATVRF